MLSSFYNGYLVVSVAIEDKPSGRWCFTVDISGRQLGLRSNSIHKTYQFQSKDEAERNGLEAGRAWIDSQSAVLLSVSPAQVKNSPAKRKG
jgi:hypothetical protein